MVGIKDIFRKFMYILIDLRDAIASKNEEQAGKIIQEIKTLAKNL